MNHSEQCCIEMIRFHAFLVMRNQSTNMIIATMLLDPPVHNGTLAGCESNECMDMILIGV